MEKKNYRELALELAAYLDRKSIGSSFSVAISLESVLEEGKEPEADGIDIKTKSYLTDMYAVTTIVDFCRYANLRGYLCEGSEWDDLRGATTSYIKWHLY